MTRINTNIVSLNAQKTLQRSNTQLQDSLVRLSTGLRINVGKDDPAGLIASELLRSDIVGTQRAITNSERANQLVATADSALGQVSSLLNDIRGLISEAANTGALSLEQIDANQLQVDASLESIDRIARVTSFQGRRLLDGSLDFIFTSPGSLSGEASTVVSTTQMATGTVSGGAADTDIVLTALSAGPAGNMSVLFVDDSGVTAGSETVSTVGSNLVVAIRSGSTTAAQIISAINAQSTTFSATASGASTGAFTASFQSGTFANGTVASAAAGAGLTITALSAGTAGNVTVVFEDSASLTAGSEIVSLNGSTLRVAIRSGVTTAAQIISAINAQSTAFSATQISGSGTDTIVSANFATSAGAADVIDRTFAASGGGSGAITIEAVNAGSAYNDVVVRLSSGGTAGSETVSYDAVNKILNVTIADGVTTAAQIISAINAQGTFSASLGSGAVASGIVSATTAAGVTSGGFSEGSLQNIEIDQANFGTLSQVAVQVVIDAQATQAQLTYSGTALNAPLTLKIGGSKGSEVRNFGAGSTLAAIATAVNLVSDATGVSARVASGSGSTSDLILTSTEYGSNAFVEALALDGGLFNAYDTAGQLVTTRVNGTDVRARVNGVTAGSDGLRAAINTSTLDLAFDVSERLTDGSSITFTITGGGANFQLGPDVVSNQQARLGIKGVSTATLGGVSGTLFELRSGEAKSLRNDVTGAGAVIDEVIGQVTQLRGRLGAFQKTTLETNIFTLNDTLENLTNAESSIRDTDFAAETARLTRAQILVQSGVSVLAIANTTPQNVLQLLG